MKRADLDTLHLAQWEPVMVRWVDSASTQGWHLIDDLLEMVTLGPLRCQTIGHHFYLDDEAITLVLNVHDQGEERTGMGHTMTIPLEAVTKVLRLAPIAEAR